VKLNNSVARVNQSFERNIDSHQALADNDRMTRKTLKRPSVKLGNGHEKFITKLITSGRYNTRDEVMSAGLRLLKQAEASRARLLKPFTREEARRAFAPDSEMDKLNAHIAKHSRPRPPEPD
jgi:putative addiction module CopG family antidote